jgi:hypothetical protein
MLRYYKKTKPCSLMVAFATMTILACNLIQKSEETPPASADNSVLTSQTQEEANRKSAGCVSCHHNGNYEAIKPMHESPPVKLGCTDCHGGNSAYVLAAAVTRGSKEFNATKISAHVLPRHPRARLYFAEYGIAGIHPLYQPRRPARCAAELRRLSSAAG